MLLKHLYIKSYFKKHNTNRLIMQKSVLKIDRRTDWNKIYNLHLLKRSRNNRFIDVLFCRQKICLLFVFYFNYQMIN